MKGNNYYGFNPFIIPVHRDEEGLLYDLLKADVYRVPSYLVKIFNKSSYTPYNTLIQRLTEVGKDEKELQSFLNEALEKGIILEFPEPYWRNEIKTSMETGFNSPEKTIPGEFFNVWLQPTGKCDRNCLNPLCNSHVNCGCLSSNASNQAEWSESQLDNLLKDLWRYKGMLLGIYIHGGNPLLFPHLDKLLTGLNQLNPLLIKLVVPSSDNLHLFNMSQLHIEELKNATGIPFNVCYNMYPGYWDVNDIIQKIPEGSEINFLMDSDQNIDNMNWDESEFKEKRVLINKKYLLKVDLSNMEWYKEKFKNDFFESVEYNEFFTRKHLHKCWGCSFAIDAAGNLKPCLWSDRIFASWKDGKISHILVDDSRISRFYRENNLENIDGCKDCIYRYGCKDCRVIAEFVANERRVKNPLCDK